MPRVLCSLPNASGRINGILFASVPNGMLSEVISDAEATAFENIPGYQIVGTGPDDSGAEAPVRAKSGPKPKQPVEGAANGSAG